MNITRRNFVQGSAAACALSLPAVAGAAQLGLEGAPAVPAPQIEKAIKASFGGGFSVQQHAQSQGQTYAAIEHLGQRYMVSSSNLWDWQVVRAI